LASLEHFLCQQRDLLEGVVDSGGRGHFLVHRQVLLGSEPEDYIADLDISTVKKRQGMLSVVRQWNRKMSSL
jgi:hypothetical protein